jgi:hypothetical protein
MFACRTCLIGCAAVILFVAPACKVDLDGGNDVKVAPYDFTEEFRNGGESKPAFDARQVPPTHTHEECRDELTKAYAEIRRLTNMIHDLREENRGLEADVEKAEDERDTMEEELDRLRDD